MLDPAFDGNFAPVVLPRRSEAIQEGAIAGLADEPAISIPRPPIKRAAQFAGLAAIAPASLTLRAGRFTPKHLAYAAEVRAALPEALVTAARDPLGAVTLVYILLLSSDWATRVAQIEQLKSSCEPGVLAEIEKLASEMSAISPEARLPLLFLSLPTLRSLSVQQYTNFKGNVERIIRTDGVVDVLEFAWQKLLLRHLEPHFSKQAAPVIQYYSWRPLYNDAAILLSASAYAGQETTDDAAKAFDVGWQQLRAPERAMLLSRDDAGAPQLDASLNRLVKASPFIKKTMLDACAYTVAADDKVCPPEAELLRAIADLLDCPIPPFIEGV